MTTMFIDTSDAFDKVSILLCEQGDVHQWYAFFRVLPTGDMDMYHFVWARPARLASLNDRSVVRKGTYNATHSRQG
jgi:hypothetical protein